MEFDKILRQWEELQKQGAKEKKPPQGTGKKANAPSIEEKAAEEAVRAAGGLSPKRAASPTPRDVAAWADDYLSHWITVHGVPDKDSSASEDSGDGSAGGDRKERIDEAARLRRMRPQAALDLHGKTASEAVAMIADFLALSNRRGLEKVLIIHGKGNHSVGEHVMTDVVRKALETNDVAGGFGPADRDQGGRGATWVRIRGRDYFSR
jgi:DNA-nicking Smr family endonuclease